MSIHSLQPRNPSVRLLPVPGWKHSYLLCNCPLQTTGAWHVVMRQDDKGLTIARLVCAHCSQWFAIDAGRTTADDQEQDRDQSGDGS